jgi:hypothetical protein
LKSFWGVDWSLGEVKRRLLLATTDLARHKG